MNLPEFFKNLKLGVKLNILVVVTFAVLVATLGIVTATVVQNVTLQTGQNRIEQEALMVRRRFAEAGQSLLTDAKLLAGSPNLVEALKNEDTDSLEPLLLIRKITLNLDEVAVVDPDGVRLADGDEAARAREDALLDLALIGIETTGAIIQAQEGNPQFRLAAVVPVRDLSGEIAGGLLVSRQVDDQFIQELNFSRENVPLLLITQGQIVAQSSVEAARAAILKSGQSHILDKVALSRALGGRTVIATDFITLANSPYALAHTPLEMGGQTEAVIAVLVDLDELTTLQSQLVTNTTLIFVLIVAVAVASLSLFARQSITGPLNQLQRVAQQMRAGDYSQQAAVTTKNEVGQLALAFNQLAEAIQTRQLESRTLLEKLGQHTRIVETSAKVSRSLSTILDERKLVSAVVEQVQSAFDYYYVHIYLFDPKRENLVMASGTGEAGRVMLASGHALPRGKGLVGRAVETNAMVLAPDVSQEKDWLPNPLLPDTKAEVAVPITAGDEVLGVLDVQHSLAGGLQQAEAGLIQSIASQVAIALRNARSYALAQRQVEREVLANTISQKIQSTTTVDQAMQIAVRELGRALAAPQTSIRLSLPQRPNGRE